MQGSFLAPSRRTRGNEGQGARIIGSETAYDVIDAFIGARFSQESRHVRRLEKVKAIEAKYLKG